MLLECYKHPNIYSIPTNQKKIVQFWFFNFLENILKNSSDMTLGDDITIKIVLR